MNGTPTLLYTITMAMSLANLLFLGIGLVGATVFARIILIPVTFLWTSVLILACTGAYALEQAIFHVRIMATAGLLGFFERSIVVAVFLLTAPRVSVASIVRLATRWRTVRGTAAS